MQALKMFTGGQQMGQVASGGGGAQNAFVGMAMGEAAKLFDQQSAQGNTVRLFNPMTPLPLTNRNSNQDCRRTPS
jgi:hypothetical protein